jgi:PAS domain S-box-containing protein
MTEPIRNRCQSDFLRLVLDANPSLVYVKDANGRFTMTNRAVAELYGTTVEQLIGKSEADFNGHPEDVLRIRTAEQEVLRTGCAIFSAAEPLTDPRTGGVRWFEIRRIPIAIPESDACEVLGIAAEVTDRKAAEDALRQSEHQFRQAQKMEAVGQLAGGVAHDFNNLLTAILGYTALLLEEANGHPGLTADLLEIKNAGERAGSLTRQLLAFSRKQVAQPTRLDLNDIVSELEKMLGRVIGEDISLETVKAQSPLYITADPNQIEQILMNLAVNARDAMPRGGVLRIETTNETMPVDPSTAPGATGSRTPCVTLVVSDTGTGIPPENLDRVFEPFFTTKGPGEGTGLGLSTVYGIVSQSGGTVAVESEPDKGARFSIRFPAVDVPADAVATSAAQGASLAGTETILLVEDEPGVRHLVQRVLSGRGYDVLEAHDVAHAAAIATSHDGPIHLLLSDIVMPGLSGPDLAQRIVAQRPDVRVLYMSGFANRQNTDLRSLSSSASVLQKPFTPEHLVRTVRDCLDVAIPNTRSLSVTAERRMP